MAVYPHTRGEYYSMGLFFAPKSYLPSYIRKQFHEQ